MNTSFDISIYHYRPYGERINVVMVDNHSRTGFIAKEKDNESALGDFGVRKYDDGIGRFMSIDMLWEKYSGWSPYQYCRNSPVNMLDDNAISGFGIQAGVVINSKKDVNIFNSDPKRNVVFTFKQFDDFMSK